MEYPLKKVLFVEQTIDGTIGGSHLCLLYLVQKINRSLYEPIVMFYEKNVLVEKFQRECRVLFYDLIKFSNYSFSPLRKGLNILINMTNVIKCYIFLVENKISIVHLNNSVSGGYNTWLVACVMARIACVTHERNFTTYPRTFLFSILRNRYKKIFAVSDVIKNHIISQKVNPELVLTVHDGIDPEAFKGKVKKPRERIMEEFDIKKNMTIIGLVGNIREWKGQEILIDALHIVHKNNPHFFCLLVGDISKNSDQDRKFAEGLLNKIKVYGLEKNVLLTGYREDVPDIINAIDIQVNASVKPDPFPHVILEGMSLGKVVIATNLGGAVESVGDGQTGFLIPPDDKILAEKLLVLMSDKQLISEMSNNAYKRIQKFSMMQTIDKVQNIYSDITC